VATASGRTLTFGDEPSANELSPVETVTAAVAACSAMDVISILAKKRQAVDDYTVRVEAIQRDEYPQVLSRIDIVHEVTGSGAIQLSAEKYCPVNAMLSAGDTEVHHRYVVRAGLDGSPTAQGEVVVTGPYRRPDPIG
jgi:putative redox protein